MQTDGALLAARGAALLAEAYDDYREAFSAVTRHAAIRFARADWRGGQADALERLELYGRVLGPAVARVADLLGEAARTTAAWSAMRDAFANACSDREDALLAQTFFNSASRRVLGTKGVDPRVEFLSPPARQPAALSGRELTVHRAGPAEELMRRVLEDQPIETPWEDLSRDAARAACALKDALAGSFGDEAFDALELVRAPFFRNKGAYVVGRIRRGERVLPLVLALVNTDGRIVLDALLTEEDEISIVFSFTRAYFHVDVENPVALVGFLRSIMPKKPVAELYIALGEGKHGKTELYRDLLAHLTGSEDLFVTAPGESGMVMAVFTLPSFDVVFKVIRDSFGQPKTSTRRDVIEKYRLVFRHGRAGRLVDTQEYEDLELPRARFEERTFARLHELAGDSIVVDGDRVVLKHLYTERRLVPLNLYLEHADEEAARAAVLDFGEALRELAATNVFPGDLLLKNFGVTRHRRVVFYDYDELCLLTDCNFRPLPAPRDDEEETRGEPWFYVGENDIFPEEFLPFFGLRAPLKEVFLEAHGELLLPGFWLATQERIRAGEVLDVFPYPQSRRLVAETRG